MKRSTVALILCLLLALNQPTFAFANENSTNTSPTDIETSMDALTEEFSNENTVSNDSISNNELSEEFINENPDTDPVEDETEKTLAEPFTRSEKSSFASDNIMAASARTEVESNDTRATADTMYAGDTMSGYMQKSGDIDCFKYVAAANGKITVSQTGIPSDKVYNLWLQNSSGGELARGSNNGSTSATSNSYTYNVISGTTYYIVTNAASGYSASQKYTISLNLAETTKSKTLTVTRQSQEKTYWCWAAVTSMLAKYEGYGKTQSQIVTYIHGSAVDKTGDQAQIVQSLKWISSSKFVNAKYINLSSSSYETVVVDHLMASKPVQVACTPTDTTKKTGHSYLIYSVQNTNTVSMIDPWGSNGNLTLGKDALTTSFYSSPLGLYVKGVSCINY